MKISKLNIILEGDGHYENKENKVLVIKTPLIFFPLLQIQTSTIPPSLAQILICMYPYKLCSIVLCVSNLPHCC